MMKHLFCSQAILMFLAWSAALSADPPAKPKAKTSFAFDPAKVQPADPAKGKPVARIFDKYLYPKDVIGESESLNEEQARRLQGVIFGTLLDRYAEKEKISATAKEIGAFLKALRKKDMDEKELEKLSEGDETRLALRLCGGCIGGHRGMPLGQALTVLATIYECESIRAEFAVGIDFVKGWKIDKSLYAKYGGPVIFQQANPFEPIGAYRSFLEEMEKQKVFEIYQEENRRQFWHPFVRENRFVWPPDDVNLDMPWWLLKAEKK